MTSLTTDAITAVLMLAVAVVIALRHTCLPTISFPHDAIVPHVQLCQGLNMFWLLVAAGAVIGIASITTAYLRRFRIRVSLAAGAAAYKSRVEKAAHEAGERSRRRRAGRRSRASRSLPEEPPVSDPTFHVVIVGAGFGGLQAAARLKGTGIKYTIIDAADGIGGTWLHNRYPGSGCDIPSHLYSMSEFPNPDWSRQWAPRGEILEYMHRVASQIGIGAHLRLGTRVVSLDWCHDTAKWLIEVESASPASSPSRTSGQAAHREFIEANVVIQATGQLSTPNVPAALRDTRSAFQGPAFHTAEWPAGPEGNLAGKDVVVVGTGATAIQLVPALAKDVRRLTVVQRSASWIVPKDDFAFPSCVRFWFRYVPFARLFYRWTIYFLNELVLVSTWSRIGRWILRRQLRSNIRRGVRSKPEMEPLVTPTTEPLCNRLLLSSEFIPALCQSNVTLIEGTATAMTKNGISVTRASDGKKVQVKGDAVVFATGFQTQNFSSSIMVRGEASVELDEHVWAGEPFAHLGITVPGFPNYFLLYGPNTNLGHSSIIFMLECQVDYIMQVLAMMLNDGMDGVVVDPFVATAADKRLQEKLSHTPFVLKCASWYKSASGRVVNNWSGLTTQYWWATRTPRKRDFEFLAPGEASSFFFAITSKEEGDSSDGSTGSESDSEVDHADSNDLSLADVPMDDPRR